jgi:HTH-type transcriptional regulator / antitoxin HigA
MTPKLIKTEKEHEAALARIEQIFTAEPGTPNGDELELLVHLVDEYEKKAYPMDLPDPVAAIRFRMEQAGLKQKDLELYIGSKSKVSEVLSGRRELSLSMIRKLHTGLGIPAEVLLREPGAKLEPSSVVEATKGFPLAEMRKRGWFVGFCGSLAELRDQLEDVMTRFCEPFKGQHQLLALNRQRVRDGGKSDEGALKAWHMQVVRRAMQEKLPAYQRGGVTKSFLSDVVALSYLDNGPLLAKELLNKRGIHVIVERHLPKTHLDGAAIPMPDGSRLVALTTRHNRLDNFWFTLLHELAHVSLHLDGQGSADAIFDDLDAKSGDDWEKQADVLAREMLIPTKAWQDSGLAKSKDPAGVRKLADRLRVHPSIVAGRVRFENHDYSLMSNLVGNGEVRKLFGVD